MRRSTPNPCSKSHNAAIARSPHCIPGEATEKGAGGGGEVEEKGGASRGHLTNRTNTYCVVERCDAGDVLTLARAAAATKKKSNAWLAAAMSVSVSLQGT